MLFIFSTPVLIRCMWQLKTVVFLHWCLMHAVLLHQQVTDRSEVGRSPDTERVWSSPEAERPGVNVITFFTSPLTKTPNKLDH
jgi:hypothetical protein